MFHEEKSQHATSFTNKISTQEVPGTKSVSRGKKSVYKFHEQENQHAISFKNKIQHASGSTNNNQHVSSSMNNISFTRRKINVQVSRRNKKHATSFANKNQQETISTKKISKKQVQWTKSVSWGGRLTLKFNKEK